MARKTVMSLQTVLLTTMCPSNVWCRRGDGTIAPLSPSSQIGCSHLRLPLSIHTTHGWYVAFHGPRRAAQRRHYAIRGSHYPCLAFCPGSHVTTNPGGLRSRACCMSVRCLASSESRTPPPNLGQEDELLLNGQHQLHRGEDGPHSGQHHHKEGEEQTGHGELLHHPRPQHHVSGLLHHHQREDQDLPGQRQLQQRHHHHLLSKSLLPQTQDALDERGPHRRVGGTGAKCEQGAGASQQTLGHQHSICTGSGTELMFGAWTLFGHAGFIKETGSAHPQHHLLQLRTTSQDLLARLEPPTDNSEH